MSDREHHVTAAGPPVGDAGRSIFPTFAVNVPMPANTLVPVPAAPPASPPLTTKN
jgi:hypothetical protein